MPKRRAPRHRKARTNCPECGRDVAAYVPRHGDGTAYRPVWHLSETGLRCSGRFEIVDATDLTTQGFDGRPRRR